MQQQQQHAHLKTHYRGHPIAVWLQLIPQLHQPNDDGNGDISADHHSFERHNTPADQFYEGIEAYHSIKSRQVIGHVPHLHLAII